MATACSWVIAPPTSDCMELGPMEDVVCPAHPVRSKRMDREPKTILLKEFLDFISFSPFQLVYYIYSIWCNRVICNISYKIVIFKRIGVISPDTAFFEKIRCLVQPGQSLSGLDDRINPEACWTKGERMRLYRDRDRRKKALHFGQQLRRAIILTNSAKQKGTDVWTKTTSNKRTST